MYEQEKWELRNAVGTRLGRDAQSVGLGLFTAFARRTVPMTRVRARAFQQHLQLQLEKATSTMPTHAPRVPDRDAERLQELPLGSVCSRCRGHCCRDGGNHAYIGAGTLARVASYLGTTQDDVVAKYLSFVPKRSYADSCIFHTASGCALPRELRSDICTRYYCSSLIRLGRSLLESPSQPYIAVFEHAPGRQRIHVVHEPSSQSSPCP